MDAWIHGSVAGAGARAAAGAAGAAASAAAVYIYYVIIGGALRDPMQEHDKGLTAAAEAAAPAPASAAALAAAPAADPWIHIFCERSEPLTTEKKEFSARMNGRF